MSAVALTACSQLSPFSEPFRTQGRQIAGNPYPELAALGTINSPLADATRSNQITSIMQNQRVTNASAGARNSNSANRQDLQGPERALIPTDIQNIPASGVSVASATARANSDLAALANRKRTAQERQLELSRTKTLRQATVAAVNKARAEQTRQKQQQQQARAQAVEQRRLQIEQQKAEFEKRKAAFQAQQAKRIADLTNIPEPKSNEDLFAIKDQEQVAIIYFEPGTPVVKDSDKAVLLEAARLLKSKGGKLLIIGHSSPPADGVITRENREANIRVSKNRTQAVAIELRKIGVPAQLMQLEAVADTQPVYSIKSPNGQSGNRRVEIYRIVAKKKS